MKSGKAKAIKILLTAVVYSDLETVETEIARFKDALGTKKLKADVHIMEPLFDEATQELSLSD